MTSSLSQRDLLLLPQTGTAGLLLNLLTEQSQQVQQAQTLPSPSPTRVTSTHMPSALCEKLIQLCNQYHVIISDNGNSMDCRLKRRNLWIEISRQLNNEFNVEFSADQYKKKYQNLKTALKTKMQNSSMSTSQRNVSPDSRREPPTPSHEIKQEVVIPASPPVRPTPQVPTTPLASVATLFQEASKNNLLALAVQAAQHQVQQAAAAANAAANAAAAGISPHLPGELQVNVSGDLDVHSLISNISCMQDQRPSSEEHGLVFPGLQSMMPMTSFHHHHSLNSMRSISSGGLLERAMDQDNSAMDRNADQETPAAGSAVGSASASDHAAPLSSLPHISPQQDEDPARLFCLSLADPLRRIRDTNPMLYVQLKKKISTIVLDAEMDTEKPESEHTGMSAFGSEPGTISDAHRSISQISERFGKVEDDSADNQMME